MQQAGRMHTNTNNSKLTIKIERNHSNAIRFIVPLLMLIVGFFLCFACVSRARNFSWQDPAAGEAEIEIRFPFELTTAMRCNNNKKNLRKIDIVWYVYEIAMGRQASIRPNAFSIHVYCRHFSRCCCCYSHFSIGSVFLSWPGMLAMLNGIHMRHLNAIYLSISIHGQLTHYERQIDQPGKKTCKIEIGRTRNNVNKRQTNIVSANGQFVARFYKRNIEHGWAIEYSTPATAYTMKICTNKKKWIFHTRA